MRVIATYGIKGGVGKTSAAVNLAALSALEGRRTLLWDLDPQGAAAFLLQVKPKVKGGSLALLSGQREIDDAVRSTGIEGLDLLPADLTLRSADQALAGAKKPGRQLGRLLKTVRADYDLVVLDCPPGLSLLTENVISAVDLLLLPLVPAPLSLRTFQQVKEVVAGIDGPRPRVHPFFSMVDGRKTLHAAVRAELMRATPTVLTGAVPAASIVERMSVTRRPVVLSHPASPAALAYRVIWAEVSGLLS